MNKLFRDSKDGGNLYENDVCSFNKGLNKFK